MTAHKRVLFLYTELAGYIRHCLEALALSGVQVHCVAYPVNPEAPFEFPEPSGNLYVYNRRVMNYTDLVKLYQRCAPQAVICSGWVDRHYLRLCREASCPAWLAFDTQWNNSMRSALSLLKARALLKGRFAGAWVPGAPQVRFARMLGFGAEHIYSGFYCASTPQLADAPVPAAKRFVYMGRYLAQKGVDLLWRAFAELNLPEWELHCAGQGDLYEGRAQVPHLHHHGFVQGDAYHTFVNMGGIFVLPSRYEPWGVVVQEFAAAGYPLLCSNAVGSRTAFLKEGVNGYTFQAGSTRELARAMRTMAAHSEEARLSMGAQSKTLAAGTTTAQWVHTCNHLLNLAPNA